MLLLPIRSLARQTGQSCNEDKALEPYGNYKTVLCWFKKRLKIGGLNTRCFSRFYCRGPGLVAENN